MKGPGVVGEQPVLPPGGSFEYTSFCPLKTAVGSMQGSYQMVTRRRRALRRRDRAVHARRSERAELNPQSDSSSQLFPRRFAGRLKPAPTTVDSRRTYEAGTRLS